MMSSMEVQSRPRGDARECTTPDAYTHAVRTLAMAVACTVLLSSPGCIVVTLHPAYDDATIEFDDGLLGAWKSDDDDTTVTFERGEWKSYRVTLATPRYTTTLSAHLTRVGKVEVLDVMPAAGVDLATLTIAVHAVFRVAREGDALTVAPIDYEAARHALPKALGIPAALDGRQNIVVTAATAEMRRWLATRAPGDALFGAGSTLRRVQAG
jgi:hypothetical protein